MASTIQINQSQRRKVLIVVALTVLCVGWLAYYLIAGMTGSGPTKAPDSTGWKIARNLAAKIAEDRSFEDVGIELATEKPLHMLVVGAVKTNEDRRRLETLLKEWRPEGDYELKLEVFKQ